MLRTPALHALAIALAGCALTPEFPAEGAPIVPDVQAFDARGQRVPIERLPRRPRLSIALAAAPSANSGPWLLTGEADDALLDDLEKLPLTAAHQARSVAARQRWDGTRVQLEPLRALEAGAVYSLALPRTAAMTLPRAFTLELHVDESPQAGAAVRSTFPAAEAAGVPSGLALALISFDGEVYGATSGVWLENASGLAHPAQIETVECADYDSAAVSCIQLRPDTPLEPSSRYQLRSGRALTDGHGASIGELSSGFTTQRADAAQDAAPSWQHTACALDERELPLGCALLTDTQIELQLFQNPAQRVVARIADRQLAVLPGSNATELQFAGLTPATQYTLTVESIDARLETQSMSWQLRTAHALPRLAITEVNADPNGNEPDQEYVELWNFGEQPEDLSGITLSDDPRALGSPVAQPVVLEPSARALLVSDAYNPTDTRDPTPAAGSLLVRVGKSVTRGGLANSGEHLFLRTAEGIRLSSAPAQPAPREGQCLVRLPRDPDNAALAHDAWGLSQCTPGY